MPPSKPRAINRKLPQRRPLRARLPSLRVLARLCGRALRRAAPLIAALFAAAGVSAGIIATYRYLRTSPRFAVAELTVTGNQRLSRQEILERAHVVNGTNIFALSTRDIETALLADPWIAAVDVRRHLPDGLAIHIEERTAAALVVIDGSGMYLADRTGRLFKKASAADANGLLVISGLARRLFSNRPELAAGLVGRALGVAALWQAHERPAIGEIHLAKDGVTLYTVEGAIAIALGRPTGDGDAELAAAMRRFDATWAALPPEERALARTIHLDSRTRPDRVTVSLAE